VDFALLASRVSFTNKFLIVSFIFLATSSFVDQHIQAGQDMYAQSQEELSKLVVGGNISDVEETKEAVMDDETGHLKRRLSSGSSGSYLSTSMMDNI
jgi:heptaprenylglyceryl phosphate synthase